MEKNQKILVATILVSSVVGIGHPAFSQGIATMYQEIHSQNPQVRQRIKQDMKLENQKINAETAKQKTERQKQEKLAHRKHHKHVTNNTVKNTKH